MNTSNVDAPTTAQHGAKVQRRQARLERHQQGQQARHMAIPLSKSSPRGI
ncbi:MAG: hypothetical protein HHJ16_07240 [Polaromonas sp.]|nr:hypothetical protein [Polaromonas sp.]NMM10052.1 hypothetical protein [Polaromonas sp.]